MAACIVAFEPAHPDEQLSVETQVHAVFGPFEDMDAADEWLKLYEAKVAVEAEHAIAPSHFTYLITTLDMPGE